MEEPMDLLAEEDYLRQRFNPKHGDPLYLHLSDLLLAIRDMLPANVSRVLDYGSGGSPYRLLFKNAIYHRADLSGRDLDFKFGPDAKLPPSAEGYDLVLSTQVLEHVESPATYLHECYRVLKPNGYLLLTTHGIFEEHGCPYDYWRWTSFGLQKIVEEAGLKVTVTKKITTGPRAVVALAERQFDALRSYPVGLYAHFLTLGIRLIQRLGAHRLHRTCDLTFKKYRVVDGKQVDGIFIALGILAIKK